MVGLPDGITACLFDLDGVLTETAEVHARAWKQTFDPFLQERGQQPFDLVKDYDEYVDGMPRLDGVRDLLASRGIGLTDDEVARRADAKNDLVLKLIREDGVEAYEGSVGHLHAARDAGLRRAVVSSSHNCRDVLDGVVAEERHLKGKPAPDTFLEGARELGVAPGHAAVFEDAPAGVAAGHAGGFGCVVGIDRAGQREALSAHGAAVLVDDLAELQ